MLSSSQFLLKFSFFLATNVTFGKPATGNIFGAFKGHDTGGVLVAFPGGRQRIGKTIACWEFILVGRNCFTFFWWHFCYLAPHVTPLPGARFIKGFLTSNLVPTWEWVHFWVESVWGWFHSCHLSVCMSFSLPKKWDCLRCCPLPLMRLSEVYLDRGVASCHYKITLDQLCCWCEQKLKWRLL